MEVLRVRNVHEALPRALVLLSRRGVVRSSRNGGVIRMAEPVATVYAEPTERVEFHPWRDSNPFFHFYESLWMLAGRNDIAPLRRYVSRMADYSDDGVTQNAAYGYRWRHARGVDVIAYNGSDARNVVAPFTIRQRHDQLKIICDALKKNPDSRQQVLQIWDHRLDLDTSTKDHACNVAATFQIFEHRLNMVVFCRSNDVIWGCYGSNAVHFSMLHEYVARRCGAMIGTYTQISVNWHAYVDVYEKMKAISLDDIETNPYDPTIDRQICPYPIAEPDTDFEKWDLDCRCFVRDDGMITKNTARSDYLPFFRDVAWPIVRAHDAYKAGAIDEAISAIGECKASDWKLACENWLIRRQAARMKKL